MASIRDRDAVSSEHLWGVPPAADVTVITFGSKCQL